MVSAIVDRLRDKESNVSESALEALARLGDRRHSVMVRKMEDLLATRRFAKQALKVLQRAYRAGAVLARWKKSREAD